MSKTISIDYLRKAADDEFSPFKIELEQGDLVLRNPIRCSKTERKAIFDAIDVINDLQESATDGDDSDATLSSEDTELLQEAMVKTIEAAAADKKLAEILLDEIGDDFGMIQVLFGEWFEEEEVGEAENSSV